MVWGGCTADSDGKIDRFISPVGNEAAPVLPLHELRSGQPYLLAMFLTGVYQEVSTRCPGHCMRCSVASSSFFCLGWRCLPGWLFGSCNGSAGLEQMAAICELLSYR